MRCKIKNPPRKSAKRVINPKKPNENNDSILPGTQTGFRHHTKEIDSGLKFQPAKCWNFPNADTRCLGIRKPQL